MAEERRVSLATARKTVVIEIEDGEYEGMRVVCSASASMRTFLDFGRIDAGVVDEAALDLLKKFGDQVLISWNLDGLDGQPLPANGEGLLDAPVDLTLTILRRWMEVLAAPDAPLGAASPSGALPPGLRVPMEPLSESLSS